MTVRLHFVNALRFALLLFLIAVCFTPQHALSQATGLFWIDDEGIHQMNPDGSDPQLLLGSTLRFAFGIKVDSSAQKMYWLDTMPSVIRSANLDGTGIETLVTSFPAITGVALDQSGGHLYWAGWEGIKRANLDGTAEEVLVSGPRNGIIGLDAAGGKIYWSPGFSNVILRTNLDGSGLETIIELGFRDRIGSLDLDVSAGKLYWTTGETIQRANLDGSELDTLFSGLDGASQLNLHLLTGKMYWLNAQQGIVHRSNLDGTEKDEVALEEGTAPTSLALDPSSEDMYWVDLLNGSLQRTNLDGGAIDNLVVSPVRMPWAIAFNPDEGHMYWTDGYWEKIQRANLDGTEVEDILEFAFGFPVSLYLDARTDKLYWLDDDIGSGSARFRKANLDGSGLEDLYSGGQGSFRVGAIDFESRTMYRKVGTVIQRVQLDGLEVDTLITGLSDQPAGIALDLADGWIYLVEGQTATIKRVNLDGSSVEVLLALSTIANSLRGFVLDPEDDMLYWAVQSDSQTFIRRSNADGTGQELLMTLSDGRILRRIALLFPNSTLTSPEKERIPETPPFVANYPNPFRSATTIEFALAEAGFVEIAIFDVLGRRVALLETEFRPAGTHRITWNGRTEKGHAVSPGMYMLSISEGNNRHTKTLLKVE